MKFFHVLGTCQVLLPIICRDKHTNTNFSYMFTSRVNFLGKRGARDTFFHHGDTVDVDTSFQHYETRQRYQTRKQVRVGEKNSMSKWSTKVYGNVGHKQIYIILFNNLNLTTLTSINHNLSKCLYCISK